MLGTDRNDFQVARDNWNQYAPHLRRLPNEAATMISMAKETGPGSAAAEADLSEVYRSWMWIKHRQRVHVVSKFCASFPAFTTAHWRLSLVPDASEPIKPMTISFEDPSAADALVYGKGTKEQPFQSPHAETRPFPRCRCSLPIPHVLDYEYPPEGGAYVTFPDRGRLMVVAPRLRSIVPKAEFL